MAWNCVRRATSNDHELLNARAEAFIARHKLTIDSYYVDVRPDEAWRAVDMHVRMITDTTYPRDIRLERLWRAIFRRAVGSSYATGIVYGYVGHHST